MDPRHFIPDAAEYQIVPAHIRDEAWAWSAGFDACRDQVTAAVEAPRPQQVAARTAAQLTALLSTPLVPDAVDPATATDDDIRTWLDAAHPRYTSLSTGERLLVDLVRTAWNGSGEVDINRLRSDIDVRLRRLVLHILVDAWT